MASSLDHAPASRCSSRPLAKVTPRWAHRAIRWAGLGPSTPGSAGRRHPITASRAGGRGGCRRRWSPEVPRGPAEVPAGSRGAAGGCM